ncbi:MAG TPA: hypothetical protein PLH92_01300 [Mycobacterium sp.]|nr:hypothetical protein [Mycobacterium sp.]HQC75341.1 hypothetical protein [Mycobacterium sp.]
MLVTASGAQSGPAEYTVDSVSLGGNRTDPLLARVKSEIGGAVDAVDRFWGTDWQRRIVVVATDSDAQFAAEAHLDPNRQWTDIAAVAVADQVDPVRGTASGQRIVMAPGAAAMSDEALRIVLTHELFHFAARARTAVDAPWWFTEGVADFVARRPEPLPAGAAADTALPGDTDLNTPGAQRSAGYDRAWWFARFVATEFGVDGLRRLYQQACGPGHGGFADAVQRALGVDEGVLQTRWAQWLARR